MLLSSLGSCLSDERKGDIRIFTYINVFKEICT